MITSEAFVSKSSALIKASRFSVVNVSVFRFSGIFIPKSESSESKAINIFTIFRASFAASVGFPSAVLSSIVVAPVSVQGVTTGDASISFPSCAFPIRNLTLSPALYLYAPVSSVTPFTPELVS